MKKRTITVEVLDYPLLNGSEFTASNYPHDGIFQLPDGRLIAKYGTAVMLLCFPPGLKPFSEDQFIEAEPQVAQAARGIDNLTFLKALAISKNPDLALDLCK